MNDYQFRTLDMFHGVNGLLESNRALYSNIPMVLQTADEFSSVVDQIDSFASNAEKDSSGITSEKAKIKDSLSHKARYLGGCAYAYAFDTDDRKMAAAVSFSFSEIHYVKDAQTHQIAIAVLSELEEHSDDLVDYGVTPEELAEFRQLVATYKDLLEDKVEIKAIGVAETKQIAYLLSYGNDLLKRKLDHFMFRFKSEQPEFYNKYVNARMIIDL